MRDGRQSRRLNGSRNFIRTGASGKDVLGTGDRPHDGNPDHKRTRRGAEGCPDGRGRGPHEVTRLLSPTPEPQSLPTPHRPSRPPDAGRGAARTARRRRSRRRPSSATTRRRRAPPRANRRATRARRARPPSTPRHRPRRCGRPGRRAGGGRPAKAEFRTVPPSARPAVPAARQPAAQSAGFDDPPRARRLHRRKQQVADHRAQPGVERSGGRLVLETEQQSAPRGGAPERPDRTASAKLIGKPVSAAGRRVEKSGCNAMAAAPSNCERLPSSR